MKEIELKNLRKRREKHFLQKNGNIIAKVYDEDIHFKKNGTYEEIDNTLIKEGKYYCNKNNEYKVYFSENNVDEIMKIETKGHYIKISLDNNNKVNLNKIEDKSKFVNTIQYKNIFDGIDLEYNIMPTKVKENIVINKKINIKEKVSFIVKTDLELSLNDNKTVSAKKSNEEIFGFELPYMKDYNNVINNNIYYELIKLEDKYILNLILDSNWLNSNDRVYPVIIDPTITNYSQNDNVYDTYIYPGDTGTNRSSQSILKVGVEKVNGQNRINRSLLKFNLPTIGTGSQVIEAMLQLSFYPILYGSGEGDTIAVHRITNSWNESDADWNTMNDKFDPKLEVAFEGGRSYVDENGNLTLGYGIGNITRLVKKWYAGTPNYGIMLKACKETYKSDIIPEFFSKDNTVSGYDPKPVLSVVYRNQNGLEDYMDYKTQAFSGGTTYVNSYNGNLTGIVNIGSTIGGKLPVSLNLVYNTNDVILGNNVGFGVGYKLNLNQTIKEVTIDDINYLEYVDEDGTIHYFKEDEGIFKDEDGLDMKIEKSSTDYTLIDKNGNKMKFIINNGIGYLSEIIDLDNNKITITYNTDKLITQVKDANNSEINLTYQEDKITIENPDNTVYLNKENNKIINITRYTGITSFTYNSNNIISSITDESGKKIGYEYYNQIPYRVKKVSEYGIDNTLGNYFELLYDFNSTTIIDNKNRASTMMFNNFGNLVSTIGLKSKDDINNAYGISYKYGESTDSTVSNKNKLLESVIPLKYVKNYLTNTSFEKNTIDFIGSESITISISEDFAETGFKSLKLNSSDLNQSIYKSVVVPKGKFYTFSAYIKNDNNIRLGLNYMDVNNELVESVSEVIQANEDFDRHDVTINYPSDATSNLFIKVYLDTVGTLYIDDIQLEEGDIVNNYNLLENSDFSNGIGDWDLDISSNDENSSIQTSDVFNVVNITDDIKALKVKMSPLYNDTFEKTFNISGKAGDTYTISFWYKNEGFISDDYVGGRIFNTVTIMYEPVDDLGMGAVLSKGFNPNDNSWQYFSQSFIAEYDFKSVTLRFMQMYNGNDFYITNMCLFKDIRSINYTYDGNGNVILSKKLNNYSSSFTYDKNNELIKTINPNGKKTVYEYDNQITDRVINSVTQNGICTHLEFDTFGNPVSSKIVKRKNDGITSGYYRIRLKGTNKYLIDVNGSILFKEDNCGHALFYIVKMDEYYIIRNSIIQTRYIKISENMVSLSNDGTLFEFHEKDDGSYMLKIKDSEMYLKYSNENLAIDEYNSDDPNYNFFIELQENQFIETNVEYSEDGKFIKGSCDPLLNKTIYDINSINGLTNSITNSKGNTVFYTYDTKKRVSKVNLKDKEVNYVYNDNNLLYKILQGNKEYIFDYDEFLNINQISIGENVPLVINEYEDNNGNLIKNKYANNHSISFDYDEFDRIKTVTKMNDVYHLKYNNNSDLVKVLSNNDVIKYTYDLAKRISEYHFNDFKIKYLYDDNDNLVNTTYILGDIKHEVNNLYDSDGAIIKTKIDNVKEINYNYDDLGRLVSKEKDGEFDRYGYVTNGSRTSILINSYDDYDYEYDELKNITHVFKNKQLIRKYYYDDYNQLIKEKNYNTRESTKYEYDASGNILSKTVYQIDNHNVLKLDKFKYNNQNWEDQLTYFNNEFITYDAIGNPITIGNNIHLDWINGKQLNGYIDSNYNITYKYNKDGIRTKKIVNGFEINYYLENSNVILEKRGENVIYYIRNGIDGLIGFKYNNDTYYYKKNNLNDIVEIVDEDGISIVRYDYDAWGNILSIVDETGQDISNDNTHIGNLNPYRYRSYYYDSESKLYYLNSRYYNPKWCRFLNADNIIGANYDLLGYNLYIYCSNNPISNIDSSGTGLLKSLAKKAANYAKKAKNALKTLGKMAMNKLQYAAKSANNFLSSIVSVNVGKTTKATTKSIVTPTVGGTPTMLGISGGYGTKSSDYVYGSSKSLISLNINCNSSFFDSSIGVSSNSPLIDSEFSIGLSGIDYSAGLKIKDNTYSLNAGLDNMNPYVGGSKTRQITSNLSDIVYGNVNGLALPLVVAIFVLGGEITIPTAIPAATSAIPMVAIP